MSQKSERAIYGACKATIFLCMHLVFWTFSRMTVNDTSSTVLLICYEAALISMIGLIFIIERLVVLTTTKWHFDGWAALLLDWLVVIVIFHGWTRGEYMRDNYIPHLGGIYIAYAYLSVLIFGKTLGMWLYKIKFRKEVYGVSRIMLALKGPIIVNLMISILFLSNWPWMLMFLLWIKLFFRTELTLYEKATG